MRKIWEIILLHWKDWGVAAGAKGKFCFWVLAAGLMLAACATHAVAETNDDAFYACLKVLKQSQYKLLNEPWQSSPLPERIEKLEKSNLDGSLLVRWTKHRNQNGSTTYVVLSRDPSPDQMAFSPDNFDVIYAQGNEVSRKDLVIVNAFAFSATQRHGVNGLLFCTDGGTYPIWNWRGSNWSP